MTEGNPPPRQATRHMLSWLSDVCSEARESADPEVSREAIADLAGVSFSMVYRFEHYADRWPREIERLLAAYAAALGIGDPRLFWLWAVERWMQNGHPLVLDNHDIVETDGKVPPAALKAFEQAIDTYARGIVKERSRSGRGSTASRSRAASGKRARP